MLEKFFGPLSPRQKALVVLKMVGIIILPFVNYYSDEIQEMMFGHATTEAAYQARLHESFGISLMFMVWQCGLMIVLWMQNMNHRHEVRNKEIDEFIKSTEKRLLNLTNELQAAETRNASMHEFTSLLDRIDRMAEQFIKTRGKCRTRKFMNDLKSTHEELFQSYTVVQDQLRQVIGESGHNVFRDYVWCVEQMMGESDLPPRTYH